MCMSLHMCTSQQNMSMDTCTSKCVGICAFIHAFVICELCVGMTCFFPFAGRDVSENQITGSLPTEVGNLGSLLALYSPSCCIFSASVSGLILSLICGWEQAACKDAAMQSMPEAGEQIDSFPLCWQVCP